MKITKFVHSCLLVETDDRVALFDPGVMSAPHFKIDTLGKLDDIFITHVHADHLDVGFVKQLIAKFPAVRITSTNEVVETLAGEGVKATTSAPAGVEFFESPHESVEPIWPQPENTGIHYLDRLTNPGDSHSFSETKDILAIPFTGPWGGNIRAINVVMELKPKHVLPIHDWHWREEALRGQYDTWEEYLGKQGIKFHKLETGQPVEIQL
jgi:L-ascorbate metabolism protein UlaG (beta-lactamase superfamily)